ncbi:MAG: RagB/SusD family nutrient uptake outer membrane protein [Bacteroidales bacterium]|nr:RagB/SusD family nutrient uptake outer membrane protein [Bacteroidales bacterium]
MRIKNYIYIAILAVICASCNLNQFPISEIAADDYIKDDASLNNAVLGVYNGLYGVLYDEWAVTELRTDNARSRATNSTSSDTKLIEQLDQATILTSNGYVGGYWDACYKAINRANTVLSKLDVCKNKDLANQYKAEALFLRSHLYFNLVRLWGPVFIVTSKTGATEARQMQRSPVEQVYDLIITDLEEVVSDALLPEKMPASDLGRADLNAAKSLLAKVYMTRFKPGSSEYERAKDLLHEVIMACGNPTSGAAMVPYDKIFATDNELNAEIIFAVRYKSGKLGVGAPFSTLYGPMNNAGNVVMGNPKHYNYPSDDLIAAFPEGDLRKSVSLRESYFNATTGQEVTGATARYCNKFIDPAMVAEYDAETDFPVIRLADVMLLYVEALNEIAGPSDEAVLYLNAVRGRAGLPAITLADVPSKYDMRLAVRKERRLEFAFENQRWFDLLRWGTATNTVNDFLTSEAFYGGYGYKVNTIQDWQCMLPVPMSVTDINSHVAQNAGY